MTARRTPPGPPAEGEALAVIRRLAVRCAVNGLTIRESRALFEALYRADALRLAGGNITAAAAIAGIERSAWNRQRSRAALDR